MGIEKLFDKKEREKVKLATDILGSDVADIIPFGISPLDIVLGGGLSCFTGDTKISLLNGEEIEIKELIGKEEFWVYSCLPDGKIFPGRGHSAQITGYTTELIEIILDNNEVIKCTSNHRFMLRDGSYKEAKYLEEGNSLMPLYRTVNERGYEKVLNNYTGKYNLTHWMVFRGIKGNKKIFDKPILHHKNFNKSDNCPTNLELMEKDVHFLYHSTLTSERNKIWWKDEIYRNKMSKLFSKITKKLWEDPIYREKMRDLSSKQMKKLWENEEFRNSQMALISKRNRNNWKNEDYRIKHKEISKRVMETLWDNPEFIVLISETMKKTATRLWQDSKFRNMRSNIVSLFNKEVLWKDSNFKEKMRIITSNTLKKTWGVYRKIWVKKMSKRQLELSILGKHNFQKPEIIEMVKKRAIERNNKIINISCPTCGKFFEKQSSYFNHQKVHLNQVINHKIKSVRIVNYDSPIPVYDFEVDEYHNFALSPGVFVHNSGKIYEVMGWESTGKSTFGLESAKAFSNYWKKKGDDNYVVLWVETESALDKLRAAWMGCDLSRFLISEAETVEEGFNIIESTLKKCVDKNMHLLAVWDTIAAAPTISEKKDSEEGSQWSGGLGEKARMIRYYLRRLVTPLGHSKSTAIFINQLYKIIKATPYGPTEDSPGGGGLKFHSSARIQVNKREDLTKIMPSGETVTEGIVSELYTVKNKLTLPKQKCSMVLYGERGFDKLETIVRYLKKNKLITQSGSWMVMNFNEKDLKFQNTNKLKEILVDEPTLENYLDFMVYQNFSIISPLIKIKIIKQLWEYEIQFLGEKKTILTDKELEIANLMYQSLNEEDEKE